MKNSIKYLVLGGNGFIGTHLVNELLSRGHYVRVFDTSNSNKDFIHKNLERIEGDFGNKKDLIKALIDIDIIFHLISTTQPQSSNFNCNFDVQSNLLNTIELLELIKNIPKVQIVFLSSGGTVYGKPLKIPIDESHPTNPLCSYGIVKLAIEKYFFLYNYLYGVNFKVLRLANPYGPGQTNPLQGVIGAFLMKISRSEPLEVWGDGNIVRDYIYISDAIDALILCTTYSGNHRIFNIGSGIGRSIQEIIQEVESVVGKKAIVNYSEKRDFDVSVSILDIELAKQELNWKPKTAFLEGLEKTMKWMNIK